MDSDDEFDLEKIRAKNVSQIQDMVSIFKITIIKNE